MPTSTGTTTPKTRKGGRKSAIPIEIALLPDRQPWEYHPWETPQSFASLQVYLRLGHTRSIAKVHYEMLPESRKQELIESSSNRILANSEHESPTSPTPTVRRRSQSVPGGGIAIRSQISPQLISYPAKYLWPLRAQHWDNHLAKIEQQAIIDQRAQLAKNCVSYGDKMSTLGVNTIDHMLEKKAKVSVEQAIKLLEAGTKLSRTGLGIDDETAAKINLQTNVQINLSNLSSEEMSALRELRRKVMGTGVITNVPTA